MANRTPTRSQSSPTRGRFGRLGPGGSPQPGRGWSAPRGKGAGGGASTSVGRRTSRSRSRSRQKSGLGRAISALGGLGGASVGKTTARSAKPAGIALLAGAAGLAIKNRGRLMQMAGREKHTGEQGGPTSEPLLADDRSTSDPMGTKEAAMGSPSQGLPDPPPADGRG